MLNISYMMNGNGIVNWELLQCIEKDPALDRRFQPVNQVPEPTADETIQILKGLREHYENHHKLRYTDEALVASAPLSYQYTRYTNLAKNPTSYSNVLSFICISQHPIYNFCYNIVISNLFLFDMLYCENFLLDSNLIYF